MSGCAARPGCDRWRCRLQRRRLRIAGEERRREEEVEEEAEEKERRRQSRAGHVRDPARSEETSWGRRRRNRGDRDGARWNSRLQPSCGGGVLGEAETCDSREFGIDKDELRADLAHASTFGCAAAVP